MAAVIAFRSLVLLRFFVCILKYYNNKNSYNSNCCYLDCVPVHIDESWRILEGVSCTVNGACAVVNSFCDAGQCICADGRFARANFCCML